MRWWMWTVALAGAAMAGTAVAGPVPGGLWRDVDEASARNVQLSRDIVPAHYRTLELARPQLESLLATAPAESATPIDRSPAILTLPMPDGSHASFRYVESSVMEAPLQLKFPQIRTYVGQGIDDPAATLRFDLTPAGFHAQILSWQGSVYIDPYQRGDDQHYISYRRADLMPREPLRCSVTGEKLGPEMPNFQKRGLKATSGTQLRTFRVAIAATGEYTTFHGGTVAGGLAAIATTLNRVNGVYERDLATRMTLVANNNLLVYTNAATDPYANTSGDLAANQTNIDAVIGAANYDIGHLVGTGGGGVAGLGVVCTTGQKARGLTGSPAPIGDPFDIDYVAHEMGHQFAGSHTFNGSVGSCGGGNRSAANAFEPGSGITIQAYAGICGSVNLANNSLDHFHRGSLDQMLAFIGSISASCGTVTNTGNTPPVVSTVDRYTIPASTPFELVASGSDGNGDTLTYNWEQMDLGAANTGPALVDNGGPLFRGYAPSTSPRRTFPSLAFILNNQNVPPATTGSFMTGELLPSTNRTMNFRVTARDNRAGGGGTQDAQTTLTVNAAAGPFRVTSPNTAVSWDAATPQTITWDVAGTAAAPISTARVRIRLSLDGGNTFPITLGTEANDGSASLPLYGATPTTQARIRIEATNNVYFDVSDSNFTITGNGPVQPLLRVVSANVTSGNNLIEPNECNTLEVTLANDGLAAATGVSATLSTSAPNLTIAQANASFPNIPAGGTATSSTPFQISSGAALQCFQPADLILSVSYGGGGSPYSEAVTLPVGLQGNGNYNFASGTGATIPVGGTLVAGSQADDAVVDLAVPAGFNFQVYGVNVSGGSTLRVSTNGTLQITPTGGSSGWSNTSLPSTGAGDSGAGAFPAAPVLLPYWDDIDTSTSAVTGGGIYTQVTGAVGSRKWIIEWRGEPVSQASSTITLNFAIEFTEGSSQFAYLYATTGGSTANGASATIGVQSTTTGSTFTQYGFNSGNVGPGVRLAATLSANVCSSGNGPCAGGDNLFRNGFE